MITGTTSVGRVVEESTCRSTKDYRFTDVGIYQIHSNALMPNIPFDSSKIILEEIDSSIFLNDKSTKLNIIKHIACQNFLTTKYIGHAPLEFYKKNTTTKKGRQFILICKNGNPNEIYRYFGTEAAIRGYNKGAADTVSLPGGGE